MNNCYTTLEKNPTWQSLFRSKEKLLICILFLSSLDIYAYGMHLMIIAFLAYTLAGGRIYVPNGLWPILLLSGSLMLFWNGSMAGLSAISRWVMYPFAFVIGYGILIPEDNNLKAVTKEDNRAIVCFIIVAVGYFGHLLINMLFNAGSDVGRNTVDYWTKEIRSATGQASFACIPLGVFIAVVFGKNTFKRKLPMIAGLLLILYYNLTLSTRTIFLMALFVGFVGLIYLMRGSGSQRGVKLLLAVGLVLCIIIIMYNRNVLGIQAAVENSEFYERFFGDNKQDISADTRWDNKMKFLEYMPKYLWGGGNIRRQVQGYAHDLFLDTYDEAGVFALIAVVAMMYDATVKLLRVLKSDTVSFQLRMILVCTYAAIYMEFMMEPVFVGIPGILLTFCLFHGMASRLAANTRMPLKK